MEKFQECQLTDVGESELTDEKEEETCGKHNIAFAGAAVTRPGSWSKPMSI